MFLHWYAAQRPVSEGWLHDLHRQPETGFEVQRTATYVAGRLRSFGLQVDTGVGGTGVVATLHGRRASPGRPGRCIGFRAELDALPMEERSGLPYASQEPGRFHGCGHDGHSVTALTAAAYLAQTRDFDGSVRFIFQPAEELLTGARAMIADGLFDRFPCDEVYALHNLPGAPPGRVAVPQAAVRASADDIDITIRANGAHGSMPRTGEDAAVAAAHLIASVQQAATRVADAREAGVTSFGMIRGGSARNVLPDRVRIGGTMRTTAPAVRDRLARLLQDAARATVNHPLGVAAAVAAASRAIGAENVLRTARPIMASEDFSEFLARVPGAYVFVGQGGRMPHHPEYAFDPDIIPVGAAVLVELARSRTCEAPGPTPPP